MSYDICEPISPRSKTISVVAYCALPPNSIFIRVPNERGRWMITERCVAEVGCPLCHVEVGEPCISRPGNYTVGVHVWRRNLWQSKGKPGNGTQHKPRFRLSDVSPAPIGSMFPLAPTP